MIEAAKQQDVNEVLPLILSAIGTIAYTLSGTEDDELTWEVLASDYANEHNRISYRNIIVDRRDGRIAGMLISYRGDDADELDQQFRERLESIYGPGAGGKLTMECQPGDYYLDAVAVDERFRGQGIAKRLIAAFEGLGEQKRCSRLSLIVEPDNTAAYSLYQRSGYKDDGELTVSGSRYIRMIKLFESSEA
ncbi:GNAT family N-acetyltransferase [Paenibacillus sp. J5C_2022]|uniref:GNAT family N-acetyltransferase n=1 Tax=Paenibacillus sp. J5C2022 TaxID=2977129 RepID=UPI0021D1BD15|nr:GNAT family N-acetyltransferase [Paenibacillus sp. J5C2022]MCU6711182.1 GNAT family N-acetyltransferase [Paenibacillus sp. J5C2022]